MKDKVTLIHNLGELAGAAEYADWVSAEFWGFMTCATSVLNMTLNHLMELCEILGEIR